LYASFIVAGVEFGARMITIDGKQIKLQIWDTVSIAELWFYDYKADELGKNSCPGLDNRTLVLSCGTV
jgi:GTPase SAR1 family protein